MPRQLPTYTSIWQVERRLYKIEDWVLPAPIPLVAAGVFVAVGLVWVALLRSFGTALTENTGVLYLVPPGLAAWGATRPLAEHKRLDQLVLSRVRYLLQPRRLVRLREWRQPSRACFYAQIWHPTREQ